MRYIEGAKTICPLCGTIESHFIPMGNNRKVCPDCGMEKIGEGVTASYKRRSISSTD
jgi:rubredoxin